MIVIVVSVCPPSLKGDLTKWLFEISTGVYAGNVSARVRDKLWERVCENIKNGRATMVYSTNNEQHMGFRVHGTKLQPVDFDGLTLMLHPKEDVNINRTVEYAPHFSKAAKYMLAKRYSKPPKEDLDSTKNYSVLDIETTGLSPQECQIIEICVLKVRDGEIVKEYQAYIRQAQSIPEKIARLTGISNETLIDKGVEQNEAIKKAMDLIGGDTIVAHNAKFDVVFLKEACKKEGLPLPDNKVCDTLAMARDNVFDVPNYKLSTLAEYFDIALENVHQARGDCLMTHSLYKALLEQN